MWSSPQKFFSVTLASQKWVSRQSPVTLASIEVDNHEKKNKYVIVPSKNFSPWRSPLKSGSLDSRPVPLASIEVDNHEKSNKYVIVPQKFFSVTLASQKWVSRQSPRATRLYWSW